MATKIHFGRVFHLHSQIDHDKHEYTGTPLPYICHATHDFLKDQLFQIKLYSQESQRHFPNADTVSYFLYHQVNKTLSSS